MKKIFKIFGITIGTILLLIIAAGIFIILYVDKEFIEEQMKSALHRHVTIKDINAGVFSVFSGIEVKDVKISNYKSIKDLKVLKGKPVPSKDIFVSLKSFSFKMKFMPLLTDQRLELKELVLHSPQINIIKYKQGVYNYSDLLAPTGKKTKEAPAPKEQQNPAPPLTSNDIPVAISIGKIGIEKGTITYYDQQLGQTFIVYNTTVLVKDIKIDPKNLKENNNINLQFNMGVKTKGKVKSGSVESFDITFAANGNAIPFDVKTKIMDPELALKMGMPKGTITGLQIFERIKTVDALEKYTGKLAFLKKRQTWKNAYVEIWYKSGLLKLQKGKIETRDYVLGYEGKTNINTKKMNVDFDLILDDKNKKQIKRGISKNVKKVVSGKIAKIVKPDDITEMAMEELLNDKGQIYMKYNVTGTYSNPKTKLLHPKVPSLKSLAKKAAGKAGDAVKETAQREAKKQVSSAKKKISKKAKKKSKKLRKQLGL